MTRQRGESLDEWIARTEASERRRAASAHVVYRAFDSYGLLLYVGCTVNIDARLSTHRSTSQWYRFTETIGLTEYPSKAEGRAAEKAAIDTEGAYFNSTQTDINRTQANANAAKQSLWRRGWYESRIDESIDPREDWAGFEAACEAIEPERVAWRRALDRERDRLKAGAFPYMTDRDRLDRYLAARSDAELARQERVA